MNQENSCKVKNAEYIPVVKQVEKSLVAVTSSPANELSVQLSNKGVNHNHRTEKCNKAKHSGALEPPELKDFEFSDYSDGSDNDSFEDTKEAQTTSDDDSIADAGIERLKRQAGSPLSQEDFKRQKGCQRRRKTK